MLNETFEVEGRVFTYKGQHYTDAEYELLFVPKGRKREKHARLIVCKSDRVRIFSGCLAFTSVPHKDRVNHRCKTPSGREFDFGGTFVNFRDLFGIEKDDIKRSSRRREPLANGWQFWRKSGVMFY